MEKNGNGVKSKAIGILLTVVGVLVVTLSGLAWARVEAVETRVSETERKTYRSEAFEEEVLRRLDRIESKLDKNGGSE